MHTTNRRLPRLVAMLGLLAAGATPAQADVTILGYQGIVADNYVKAVVEPFTKATGIKVNYRPVQTAVQNLGTLRAEKGNASVDLSIMDAIVSRTGNTEGIFEPVDEKDVPNIANLFPEARPNGQFGPGVTFDHLVLIYNTDEVKPPPAAFADMWKPANAGKVIFNGAPSIEAYMLMILIDRQLGADESKTVQPAVDRLAELAPSVMSWHPTPDPFTLVANGTARIGIGWNARAQAYRDTSRGKLGVVLPAEGSMLQINTINLVKGAPSRAEALKFMNYALSPEAQAAFTNALFYAPTNRLAQPTPEAVRLSAASPEDRARMRPLDWSIFVANQERWLQLWRRQILSVR